MNNDFRRNVFGPTKFGNKTGMIINNNKSNEQTKGTVPQKFEILDILKEDLYNSLSQAIIKTIMTPFIALKIFLTISIILSSSLASYLVISATMTYINYGVFTESRTVYENPALFPKVTFCNLNWFTTQYAFNMTQMGIKWSEISNFSNEEKKKLGHDLSDILIACSFNLEECTPMDFVWSFDENYGNCYTFNSGFDSNREKIDLKQSHVGGPQLGLQFTLYVNIYEELLNNTTDDVYGLGAVIRIGNSSFLTFDSSNDIYISAGFQTNIAIKREFKSMLPHPYSNCKIELSSPTFRTDSDLYNLIGETNYAYSQQLCFSQCMQKDVIEKYNCSLYIFISLYNVTQCDYELYLRIINSSDTLRGDFINDKCIPRCPLECNQTEYKTSLSSYQLIGNQFVSKIEKNQRIAKDFLNRTLDSTTVEKSFVRINIFYDSLSYTLTTESPEMNFISLLASIGGNLGLFLGVSVFSICELIEMIIEIFFILKNKNFIRQLP